MFGNQNSLNWGEINDQDCLHYWVQAEFRETEWMYPRRAYKILKVFFALKRQ